MTNISKKIYLGLDLAIRTGSLIKLEVDGKLVIRYKILCSWTNGPRAKSGLDNIVKFFEANVYPHIYGARAVAIDWSPNEAFYGGNRKSSNQKTFVAGHLFKQCQASSIKPVFLDPRRVRSFFGYNSQADKFEIQRKFLSLPKLGAWTYPSSLTEHDVDALILAYILSQTFIKN